jgi:putative heme degradation protein
MNREDIATREIRSSAQSFLDAHKFLQLLRKHRNELSRQELETLRGQALHGDVDGANKGLDNILARR